MDKLKAGDRVRLVNTTDPYTDLGPGTLGVMVSDEREPSKGIAITGSRWPGCHPENPDGYTCPNEEHGIITEYTILSPKWDNGSWLQMIPEAGDVIEKIDLDATCPKCNSTEHVTSLDFNEKPQGGWWSCSACTHKFEHRVVHLVTPRFKIA